MEYDANFGSLVRKKAAYPLDGIPLVVGIAGLLKQFHPQTTRSLLSHIGQFVRTYTHVTVNDIAINSDTDGGKAASNVEYPVEVLNSIIFVDQLCTYAGLPRAIAHEFIPAYIFDTLKVN